MNNTLASPTKPWRTTRQKPNTRVKVKIPAQANKRQMWTLTTTGLNFIGGDEDDVTILCAEERGNIRPLLAEFGAFWAETGLNDDDVEVCCGFEETEEDEVEESSLFVMDLVLGMDDKG